jgi:predicted alpha/beta superfamily hydrolase
VTAASLALPAGCDLGRPGAAILAGVERHEVRGRDGARYRIFIAAPPAEAGPVGAVYQLDANAGFATMVEAARLQARRPARTGVGPLAVIGIGYPTEAPFDEARRSRDFTPWPAAAPAARPEMGGADVFLDFLAQDLIPAVESHIAVDPARRGLFGHSLGGLFALHVLFTRPGLFSVYAACSPSLWWSPARLAAEERNFIAGGGAAGRRLMLAVGGAEEPAHGTDAEARRLKAKRMVTRTRALAERLAGLGDDKLGLRCDVLAEENHASVVPAAIARWLRFFDQDRAETGVCR